MKKFSIFLLIALLPGLFVQSLAQDRRTLTTRVADIMTQMPANDLKHLDRLMTDMIGLGENGLLEFTKMIVPDGSGDDTRARFALGSLASYVGVRGLETERLMVSKVFTQALDNSQQKSVKRFFLYHLAFFAKNEAVPVVAGYLNDDDLVSDAVSVLQNCGSHEALHAMIGAVPQLSERNRVVVVETISEFGAPCALDLLSELVGSEDIRLQRAVLSGLAAIGDPASYKTMNTAAKNAGYQWETTGAVSSLLKYAEVLGQQSHLDLSQKICTTLIKKCVNPGQQNFALAAIGILVEQQGYEAMPYLLEGIRHPEKHFRGAVLRHASQIDDIAATRVWMDVYKSSSIEVQTELMSFFGHRSDRLVLPLVRSAMQSENPDLKKEAFITLGKLNGSTAVPELLSAMSKSTGTDVIALQQVLNTLAGPYESSLVAGSYDKQKKEGKIAIIELLAVRQATDHFDLVYSALNDADKDIQAASYRALANVSAPQHMSELLNLLNTAKDDQYLQDIQAAIVAAAKSAEGNTAERILDAYASAGENQYRYIAVLPKLGGAEALQVVSEAFSKGDNRLRKIAFEALTKWSDHTASDVLLQICQSDNQEFRKQSFDGFVRQISASSLPNEQKLLLLRKVYPLASDNEQKISVVNSLQSNKTFLTLMFLSQLMEDPALANTAGRAAANVALPPSGTKEGMYGKEVRIVLEKALSVITGEESDYIKTNIRRWLAQMPADDGFVSVFNGKDLTGWKGLVENPVSRSKMSEKELADKQRKADARLPEMWTVMNREIRFTGTGYENLCSVKDYGDFEMFVDWRITKNGDSGIYLRGTPQVQIWDTSRVDVGAQVGSGGLYNNQRHPAKPLLVADNPINDWNTFYIKMVGDRVTVFLNGQLVVDNVVLENYWDRSQPIFPVGAIELQAHGTDLAFRDIYVREIKKGEYNLSVEEKTDGFVSLFNGKSLDGWIGNKTDYIVEEGVIVIRPQQGGSGNLYTEKEYADFNFRFEFLLTPGANNGLGIRTPPEGDAAYVGMELQILDNTAPIYAQLAPYQYHGSVYGVIPAKRGFLKPVGEWNSQEVIVQGTRIKIILNGNVIVDGDIAEARDKGTLDHQDHPGLKNDQGHIGFLGHGSVVKFRNIRVKEL